MTTLCINFSQEYNRNGNYVLKFRIMSNIMQYVSRPVTVTVCWRV